MRILSAIHSLVLSIISKIFWLLEIFLFLRLLLKFLKANPGALVVSWIYSGSDILVSPFHSIFRNISLGGFTIDAVTLSAMIGYAILSFIVLKTLRLFGRY